MKKSLLHLIRRHLLRSSDFADILVMVLRGPHWNVFYNLNDACISVFSISFVSMLLVYYFVLPGLYKN